MYYHESKKDIVYFLYARKSSESEDRQIQSIESQVNRLKELANNYGLKIKEVFTEAKSAKQPNNRPIFDQMIKRIEAGEAQGILAWQINRISRNPIDSAKVQWLLQQGILQSLQTIDREYRPDDNVLLFNVESGSANQFILDLSKNVKRGNLEKVGKGWKLGVANIGYINDLRDHTVIVDPERFPLLRKAWDIMLTGNYTVPEILHKLNNEWGLRTLKRRKVGGTPLSLSGLYAVFTNIMYTGIFEHNGKQYQGQHTPMVTLQEFDRVQMLLGRKGKPRPQKYVFPFTGLIRCGECGCSITAETKKKYIKSTGNIQEYTYYRCTRKKPDFKCTQKGAISDIELEKQIVLEIEKFTILPEFKEWALEGLSLSNDKEIEDRSKIYEMQHKTLVETQKELDNLTRMRYKDMIDDETFKKEKESLDNELLKMKQNLRETEQRAENWVELTEKAFHFAVYAREHFLKGGIEEKKTIVATLGSNQTLKDKKFSLQANFWLQPIIDGYPPLKKEFERIEPTILGEDKRKSEAFASLIPGLQARPESN